LIKQLCNISRALKLFSSFSN